MTLSKKHYVILIVGLIAVIAVWYFLFYKKGTESSYDPNLLILGGPLSRTAPVAAMAGPKSNIPGVTPFSLGKVKLTGPITNKPGPCPQGSKQTQLPDGTFSCIAQVA